MLNTNPVAGGQIEVGPEGLLLVLFPFPTVGAAVYTVRTILLLVALMGVAHVAFEGIITVILEELARELVA
jgi:hypothetical protein